jgi:DNA-binding NarL/FixJ family response regulator
MLSRTGDDPQSAQDSASFGPPHRLLLISDRPSVAAFLRYLADDHAQTFTVVRGPLTDTDLIRLRQELAQATVALIDVCPAPAAAVRGCQRLHTQCPDLPLIAMMCCPNTVEPSVLRELMAAGVTSVLDGYLPPAAIRAALKRVVRGGSVWHLRRDHPQENPAHGLLVGASSGMAAPPNVTPSDEQLLVLVAQGLTNNEIGEHLHRAGRSVQRWIDRLCAAVGARDRTHLAVWAAERGLARFAPATASDGSTTGTLEKIEIAG